MRSLLSRYGRGALLDVGCGTGDLLAAAASLRRFDALVGLDVSDLPLARARVACPEAQLLVADICEAPLASRFDVITCMMTLDLVSDEQRAARHLAHMLNPGGHLLVVVQHLHEYRTSFDDTYQVRRHDQQSLATLLGQAGLERVESFAWGYPLYNFYYRALEQQTAESLVESSTPLPLFKLASRGLTQLFRLDDLFRWTGRGRVLFGAFRKP
jgi:ubiquinone/menaquinone biosynthesis C-methylase UbiE